MSIPATSQQPLPPLAGLVAMLRANGFMVTTDDYVHLLKILEEWGSEPPDSLALRICPIIATTDDEQRRFYHVFGNYMQRQQALGTAVNSSTRWRKWALVLLAIAVTLTVYFLALPKTYIDLNGRLNSEITLRPGEPYKDDVIGLGIALGDEKDTIPLQAQWVDSGRGIIGSGESITHALADTGLHVIQRTILDGPQQVRGTGTRQLVYLCASAVALTIDGPEKVVTGRAFSLRANPYQGADLVKKYTWDTSELEGYGRVLRSDSAAITLQIDSPGIYTLRCAPVAPSATGRCIIPASIDVLVVDTGKQYEISFAGSGRPFVAQKKLVKSVWILLLSVLTAIGYWGFVRRRKRRRRTKGAGPGPVITSAI